MFGCVVCLVGCWLGQAAAVDAPLQKIVQQHRSTRAAIERFFVQGRCQSTGPVQRRVVFFWARQGARYRYRMQTKITSGRLPEPKLQFQDEYADEKERRSMMMRGTEHLPRRIDDSQREAFRGSVEPRGTDRTWANPEIASMFAVSLRSYRSPSGGIYLEQLLDKAKKVQWKSEPDGKVRIQLQVAAGPDRPEVKESFTLWLEPSAGFLISRIETAYQDLAHSWRSTSYVEGFYSRNGAYWPKKVVSQLFHNNVSLGTVEWVFERVLLNEPLPEGCFEFRFPQGAWVAETQGDEKIVRFRLYGENNQVVRTFTPEEYRQYRRKRARLPPEPRAAEERTAWPLVATLGLLALAVGLALLWRRAGRTTPPGKEPSEN